MGSVRFVGEKESKPSTNGGKKYKLPKKLLDDCGAVNHASVPRKIRSDIKKRSRESIIPPLPISRKKRRGSNRVATLKKNGAKKSRQNKKRKGQITEDEEEVAETLYSLADMFSDVANTKKKPVFDDKPTETKSSTIVVEAESSRTTAEDAEILRQQEEINTKVAVEAVLVNSTAGVAESRTWDDAKQPELPFGNQSPAASVFGVRSNLSLGPRPNTSTPDTFQSCEQMIALEQVSASGVQYDQHHNSKEDKFKGIFQSPSSSSTGILSSETQKSCLRCPPWLENTNSATPSRVIENIVTADKIHYPRVMLEPEKWKSCSGHVYIARRIECLQKSDRNKGLLQKASRLITSEGVEQGPYTSIDDNQKRWINGENCVLPFNCSPHSTFEDSADNEIAMLSYKRLLQDQLQASRTSAMCPSLKQGSDYLSLAVGGCSSDAGEGVNKAGYSFEASKQNHVLFPQLHNYSTMLSPQPQNGYSSTFNARTSAAAQVHLSPYLRGTVGSGFMVPRGHHLDSHQQKLMAQIQIPPQYNSPSLPNYAQQALFPRFQSALGSNYQHFNTNAAAATVMHVDLQPTLSNVERHYGSLYPDNSTQLQLLCDQRL